MRTTKNCKQQLNIRKQKTITKRINKNHLEMKIQQNQIMQYLKSQYNVLGVSRTIKNNRI